MRYGIRSLSGVALLALTLAPAAVLADDDRDIEGAVESIDAGGASLVVGGQTYHVGDRTDYDDDLNKLTDLKVGDRVEIDYIERDGKRIIVEIERDD